MKKTCQKFHRQVADLQLYQKGVPTLVFLSKYCEIFKNTYFEKHLLTAAYDFLNQLYRTPVNSSFCSVQIIYQQVMNRLVTIQSKFTNLFVSLPKD